MLADEPILEQKCIVMLVYLNLNLNSLTDWFASFFLYSWDDFLFALGDGWIVDQNLSRGLRAAG